MKFLRLSMFRKSVSCILIILTLFQSVGCWYKAQTVDSDLETTIKKIQYRSKYFLVHSRQDVYALTDISVDSLSLYGTLELAKDRIYYEEEDHYNSRYLISEKDILNEVHFYLNKEAKSLDLATTKAIPLSAIKEIRIIEKNTGKIVGVYVGSGLGVGVIAFIIAVIVAFSNWNMSMTI